MDEQKPENEYQNLEEVLAIAQIDAAVRVAAGGLAGVVHHAMTEQEAQENKASAKENDPAAPGATTQNVR